LTQCPIGRRAFLALTATSLLSAETASPAGKGSSFVFPPQHFLDRATELDLYRLTDPKFRSVLPAPHLHFVSRRGRFLIVCSERSGLMQAWRLDWHNGESRQLTSAAALDPASVALTSDDRALYFCDGPTVKQMAIPSLRERDVARVESGWERAPGFTVSLDGSLAVWVERSPTQFRLRSIRIPHGNVESLLESESEITDPQLRPRSTQVFFRLGGVPHLLGADDLPFDRSSGVGQVLWSPTGASLFYLSVPSDRAQLTTIREFTLEDKKDRLIAKTSQFASFGVNSDASVFVGASRSLASPYLLLLVRSVRRELTLCEHRCSDARLVNPVFSPDSQNVFFVSDRNGKSAVYRSHVERFVEETDSDA
jgi:oligogalacturonide lyase